MQTNDKNKTESSSQITPQANQLGLSILKGACNSEGKALIADWSDLGLDALLAKTALEHAPMFGSVVKICAVYKNFRELRFVRMVFEFLRGCPKFDESEKEAFVKEHLEDDKKTKKLAPSLYGITKQAHVMATEKGHDMPKPTTTTTTTKGRFKVLRAVDPSVIGGGKAVEVSQGTTPKQVHYPNAKGGLRPVEEGEVRELAKASAIRLLQLAKA